MRIVLHTAELQYLFPDITLFGANWTKTPAQMHLQRNMMDYWISFAVNLDPNDGHGNTNRAYSYYQSQTTFIEAFEGTHWPEYNTVNPVSFSE